MSGNSLAATLHRLNSCQEAADLIYSKDAAQLLAGTANTHAPSDADFSIVIARRIATMVARLNDLASPASQVVLTPRMVLCELMDIVRQALYTSLPAPMQEAATPSDKMAVVRQFNTYASMRQIPLEAAAEGLYAVSYVSVKLRVELVALQLRRRIQEELEKKDTQASEGGVAALVVTETLLEDFLTIYNNIVLTLPITKAAGSQVGNESTDAAAAAAERLVPVFLQYFYQLCDWVLVLDSTMKGPVMSYTQVKRLAVDEQRGSVVVDLHRPTPQTAWGLLLNEQGCLVDIDVSLRVFEKAKQLHHLLQATPQGAHITKINDISIPPVRQGNYAAYAQKVLETLQTTTAARKNVQLSLQSSAFKAAARSLPTEVAFVAPPQGGEGTSGQRVTLVLRRQSTTTEWGFSVDDRLYFHPPASRTLSEAARGFMKAYGRHLRLLAVNGVEALHTTQVGLLMESAETVVLELLVMPSFAGERGRGGQTPHRVAHTHQDEAEDGGVVETSNGAAAAVNTREEASKAPKAVPHTRKADTALSDAKMEAAVAKFMQTRTQDSTSPSATAAPSAGTVEPTVAMETPLVDAVMTRPSPSAAAAAIAAVNAATVDRDGEPKRKRGRPRKVVVESGDAAPAADPAVVAPAQDDSAKNGGGASEQVEVAQVEPIKKRGRTRKTPITAAVQEEPAAASSGAAAEKSHVPASAAPSKRHHHHSTALDVNDAAVQNVLAAFADENGSGNKEKKKTKARKLKESDKAAASVDDHINNDNKKQVEGAASSEAACVFDNKVQLLRLTEEEMVLERPSADMPWGLPIGRIADTTEAPQQLPLRLMSLPPVKAAAVRTHPFLSQFNKDPTTWFIAEVNGKPASNAEATLKSIAKLTRMTLRFLRK